jgi:hypothetical protein
VFVYFTARETEDDHPEPPLLPPRNFVHQIVVVNVLPGKR